MMLTYCTPLEIANDILGLPLAYVYDALSYYEDHQEMVDEAIRNHTPEVWRQRLQQALGPEITAKLLGERDEAY